MVRTIYNHEAKCDHKDCGKLVRFESEHQYGTIPQGWAEFEDYIIVKTVKINHCNMKI